MVEKPVYSTWIRKSRIVIFWCMSIVILTSSFSGFLYRPLFFLGFFSIPFLYIAFIISLTSYQLSSIGGDFQNKIHQIVISNCPLIENVLDIGCGNAHLIIKYAEKYPNGHYTGIDYWGDNWEYSQVQCQKNAKIENVENVAFYKASASELPFADNDFTNVISCLTFHEVKDVDDKMKAIIEALRVLKPKGKFAFFDLFNDKKYFESMQHIVKEMKKCGVRSSTYQAVHEIMKLPFPLMDKRSLKYGVLLTGIK